MHLRDNFRKFQACFNFFEGFFNFAPYQTVSHITREIQTNAKPVLINLSFKIKTVL